MTSQQLHFQGGVKSKFNIHIKCFLIIVEKQRIPSERLKEVFHSGLKMWALRLTRGGGLNKISVLKCYHHHHHHHLSLRSMFKKQ